jgi:hypothetical protein
VHPERKSDNLSANLSRLSKKCGIPDIFEPYNTPGPIIGPEIFNRVRTFANCCVVWSLVTEYDTVERVCVVSLLERHLILLGFIWLFILVNMTCLMISVYEGLLLMITS